MTGKKKAGIVNKKLLKKIQCIHYQSPSNTTFTTLMSSSGGHTVGHTPSCFTLTQHTCSTQTEIFQAQIVTSLLEKPLKTNTSLANIRVTFVVLETVAEDELHIMNKVVKTIITAALDFALHCT